MGVRRLIVNSQWLSNVVTVQNLVRHERHVNVFLGSGWFVLLQGKNNSDRPLISGFSVESQSNRSGRYSRHVPRQGAPVLLKRSVRWQLVLGLDPPSTDDGCIWLQPGKKILVDSRLCSFLQISRRLSNCTCLNSFSNQPAAVVWTFRSGCNCFQTGNFSPQMMHNNVLYAVIFVPKWNIYASSE